MNAALFFVRFLGPPLLVLLAIVMAILFLADASRLVGEPIEAMGESFFDIGEGMASLNESLESAKSTVAELKNIKNSVSIPSPEVTIPTINQKVSIPTAEITSGLKESFTVFEDLGQFLEKTLAGIPLLAALGNVGKGLSQFAATWTVPILLLALLGFIVWLLGYVDFALRSLLKVEEEWKILRCGAGPAEDSTGAIPDSSTAEKSEAG
ncbi:MAG: hypothetical protein AAGJ79_00795 [Verrucomicrobiota bacterium]